MVSQEEENGFVIIYSVLQRSILVVILTWQCRVVSYVDESQDNHCHRGYTQNTVRHHG